MGSLSLYVKNMLTSILDGPVFYDYFYDQNQAIANGSAHGFELSFNTLGVSTASRSKYQSIANPKEIGDGLIDYYTQAPYYPKFAVENTYGIKAVNETVYNYMEFALTMENGCLAQIGFCRATDRTNVGALAICAEAADMCRDNVEGTFSESHSYSI